MADIYFDFSATNDGDGTAPEQAASGGAAGAFNTILGRTPANGDNWWIRRTSTVDALTTNGLSIDPDNFTICGWPKSGDRLYDSRPAAGITEGWDADGDDYAVISWTTGGLTFQNTVTNGVICSRLSLSRSSSGTTYTITLGSSSARVYMEHIVVDNPQDSADRPALGVGGDSHYFNNLDLTGSRDTTAARGFLNVDGDGHYFTDVSIDVYEVDDVNDGCALRIGANDTHIENISINISNGGGDGYIFECTGDLNVINSMIVTDGGDSSARPINIAGVGNAFWGIDWSRTGAGKCQLLVSGTANVIEIEGLIHDHSSDAVVLVTGDANKVVGKDCANLGAGHVIDAQSASGSVVLLDGCTTGGSDLVTISSLCNIYHINAGGTAGYWRYDNRVGFIQSSTVVRTGGASFSLQAERTVATEYGIRFPDMGGRAAEFLWLSLPIGSNTITMYGAHKNFTDALRDDELWLEAVYIDADGNEVVVSSRGYGSDLLADGSAWTGDTGLTEFRLPLAFTLPSAQVVPVRWRGAYAYEANAYIYLDPEPVVS